MTITVREATQKDNEIIYSVEERAFNEPDEADLVTALVADPTAAPMLSLIAFDGSVPVGHILFTKGTLIGAENDVSVMILAPLAVIPDYQKQGIGGLLIRAGLDRLRAWHVDLVFVLGHIDYYPRHGFVPALQLGFMPPYPTKKGLEDAWMVQSLTGEAALEYQGKVHCADVFMKPENW